jgi:DNA transformation protein and related proteins
MSVSRTTVDHLLDLLSLAGAVSARSMFGGYGLYLGGAMFGLVDDDELFLKADDQNRQDFLDAGCRQWIYPSPKGPMGMPYYRPPDDAHEDAEAMLPWARLAIGAARRAAAAKAEKARLKTARAKARGRPAKAAGAGRKARPAARKGK